MVQRSYYKMYSYACIIIMSRYVETHLGSCCITFNTCVQLLSWFFSRFNKHSFSERHIQALSPLPDRCLVRRHYILKQYHGKHHIILGQYTTYRQKYTHIPSCN